MNTLDRYIARQYLFNVAALIVLLFTFVVAIDVTLNIDRFVDRAKELEALSSAPGARVEPSTARRVLLTVSLVFNLWGPKLLQLFTYTVGLALVGAMGFTLTQMVRHRELVALMASGISLRRVARPIVVVACVFLALKIIDHEVILSHPRIAPLLVRDHGDAGNVQLSKFSVPLTAEAPDPVTRTRRVFMAESFSPEDNVLEGLNIWERDARGVAVRHLVVRRAVWSEVNGKGGWDLAGVESKSLGSSPEGTGVILADNRPTPTRIETDLGPDALVFRRHATYAQNLSWPQISRMLRNENIEDTLRDKLERIRWGRLSTTLTSLLSLVITVPFFLLREPSNMLAQSLKCAPVGIVALLGSVILTAMPVPGLPAGFGAMLPVFILLPIAIASVSWVKT